MVPVALRLKNFLSYGTAAGVLDFELFHVACLSGRNGQGKSALLDAMTWALWGEARKSNDSRKPDEGLMRIGSRQMEVDFVFDLDGARYRIVRAYALSQSGKTPKPQLEFQLFDAVSAEYHPLTAPSIRETQKEIDARLGIDYETFINSAFLLQGRSDEFTKKKPTERKQILARILDLSRYDRLADRARVHEREAVARLERAEVEVARLQSALEDEPTWKARQAEVKTAIGVAEGTLERLRAEEKKLTERRAALEARAREADAVRAAVTRLDAALARDAREATDLRRRLEETDHLLAQREQIERDFNRRETLNAERTALEDRQHLDRALEDQVRQREADLNDRRNDIEKKLHSLRVEIEAGEGKLSEYEMELVEAPSVRRQLASAREAHRRLTALTARRDARRAIEADVLRAEQRLVKAKADLEARLGSLTEALTRQPDPAPEIARLTTEHSRLSTEVARLEAQRVRLEEIRLDGQQFTEAIEARKGRMEARQSERDKLHKRLDKLRALDTGTCPTCGTELTDDHRAEVERDFQQALAVFDAEDGQDRAWMADQERQRNELRRSFKTQREAVKAMEAIPASLAEVETRLTHHQQAQTERARKRDEAATLRQTLEAATYGATERSILADLRRRLAELDFDEAAFEAAQQAAGGLKHLEERHHKLENLAGRKEQITNYLTSHRPERDTLQQQLADGSLFGPMREQIRRLMAQREQVGFDAKRLETVRQSLKEVEKAGERMQALVQAQQEHPRLTERLKACTARQAEATTERAKQSALLAVIEADLGDRAALAEAARAKAEACEAVEVELRGQRVQLGELNSRLEQARADRAALKERRREHGEATSERALYKHLRAAFGKHGIPSLIIEQTLPEIEHRANELLDRLTDGRMHVRLDTLKDKKTGGTKETLEIIITDEQGVPRSYETFSGGEAFRVNFALRIALSQLLAERSGVQVRTLVIDEGFGTQDAQGIENLVEAIQVIQDDFDKIVVITHLSQLKEAFPVRIEVEKDPVEGSRFQIIGV